MRVAHEADTWKEKLKSHHILNIFVQGIECQLLPLTILGRHHLHHGMAMKFSQDF